MFYILFILIFTIWNISKFDYLYLQNKHKAIHFSSVSSLTSLDEATLSSLGLLQLAFDLQPRF